MKCFYGVYRVLPVRHIVKEKLPLPFLVEFVLWELSIASSLPLYSILVQHACNDRAWLTSELLNSGALRRDRKLLLLARQVELCTTLAE